MASNRELAASFGAFGGGLALILMAAANCCHAQAVRQQFNVGGEAINTFDSTHLSLRFADHDSSTDTQSEPPNSSNSSTPGEDSNWHVSASPYLWFPGMHGTVGLNGNNVKVSASAGDLLSHFRFGLKGAVELRRKRLVTSVDIMWVRLGDDKSVPIGEVGTITADMKDQLFLLTPKVGLRLIDQERFKVDALPGFRFWHVGQSLKFSPSDLSFSGSGNWVDPLVGGRTQFAPTPKITVDILGDVGGWGAASQIDDQVAGLLGYRIKARWTFAAGYRYMGVDYRSGGFLFDVIQSGAVFGATMNLK